MKAFLRSTRISPKKANLVAKMIRGMSVKDAKYALVHTNKKASRLIEQVLDSAVANAENNDGQNADNLVVKTVVVNKSRTYHRGVPMARGRVRPIKKFLSHISVTLGVAGEIEKKEEKKPAAKKADKPASQKAKETVKKASSTSTSASKDTGKGSSSQKKTAPKSKVSAESPSSSK